MISVCLVMVVEAFSFLPAVGVEECGIKVKQHMFRMLYRVYDLPHFRIDSIKLGNGIFIHAVKEPGQGRLRCQRFLFEDCSKDRVICQLVGAVIFEICRNDLIDHLHEVICIRMPPEHGRVICVEQFFYQFDKSDFAGKLLDEQEPGI